MDGDMTDLVLSRWVERHWISKHDYRRREIRSISCSVVEPSVTEYPNMKKYPRKSIEKSKLWYRSTALPIIVPKEVNVRRKLKHGRYQNTYYRIQKKKKVILRRKLKHGSYRNTYHRMILVPTTRAHEEARRSTILLLCRKSEENWKLRLTSTLTLMKISPLSITLASGGWTLLKICLFREKKSGVAQHSTAQNTKQKAC